MVNVKRLNRTLSWFYVDKTIFTYYVQTYPRVAYTGTLIGNLFSFMTSGIPRHPSANGQNKGCYFLFGPIWTPSTLLTYEAS